MDDFKTQTEVLLYRINKANFEQSNDLQQAMFLIADRISMLEEEVRWLKSLSVSKDTTKTNSTKSLEK